MSDTPETDALREAIDSGGAVEAEMTSLAAKLERERDRYKSDVEVITKERDEQTAQMCQAIGYLSTVAEDCEAWLNGESDEPSMEFIKLVAKYAREAASA